MKSVKLLVFMLLVGVIGNSKVFSMEESSNKRELSKKEKSLVVAIQKGDCFEVHSLIFKNGVDPFPIKIDQNKNLLHLAVSERSTLSFNIVNMLLLLRKNKKDNKIYLIKEKNKKCDDDEEMFDVNSKDTYGNTPLHIMALRHTCKNDDHLILETLIKEGADVNAKARYGCTPVDYAYNVCGKTMRILITNGGEGSQVAEGSKAKLWAQITRLSLKVCPKISGKKFEK